MVKGHIVKISINTKDVLEDLVRTDGMEYINILPHRRKKNTKLSALWTLLKKDVIIFFLQLKGKYDLLVGTESALAHIGWLLGKPFIMFDEDDAAVVPETSIIAFPFARKIVSPNTCNLGRWTRKKIGYNGFQKTAYLHPNYFSPNREVVYNSIGKVERYFMIRASGLSAYHDTGKKGLTLDIIRKLVELLKPHGMVLLSTERQLPEDLQSYLYKTKVDKIHHFLFYADFIVADSQSMCVEAALLGTPSIRFSDFVGKISVLEELEHEYGLTYGIPVNKTDRLFALVNDLLQTPDIKSEWQKKRMKMLEEKIDVTAFWTWMIDNYPESESILENDPNYPDRFKNPTSN